MGAGKLEENSRSPRNCKHVYSLLSGAAAVAADNAVFSPLVVDPADIAIMQPQRLFQVELIFPYRTYVACGQASTL